MRDVELSQRLQMIADMVTPGSCAVDVGCDHGFLSIYLVQQKISPRVIAMDVREGPLSRAREHIAQHRMEAYIETRLSDGLKELALGEGETCICAGMGGRLMARILTEGREKARSMEELILQPQSELVLFRRFLKNEGFLLLDENILCEDGKYYFLMKVRWAGVEDLAVPGTEAAGWNGIFPGGNGWFAADVQLGEKYGPLLLARRHPVLRQYLEESLAHFQAIEQSLAGNSNERARERLTQVQEELSDLRRALEFFEEGCGDEVHSYGQGKRISVSGGNHL